MSVKTKQGCDDPTSKFKTSSQNSSHFLLSNHCGTGCVSVLGIRLGFRREEKSHRGTSVNGQL